MRGAISGHQIGHHSQSCQSDLMRGAISGHQRPSIRASAYHRLVLISHAVLVASALMLDASSRVVAAAGSGLIDLHAPRVVDHARQRLKGIPHAVRKTMLDSAREDRHGLE